MANQDLSKTNTTIGNQSFLSRVSSFRQSSRVNFIIQLLDDAEQITLQLKSSSTGQAVLDAALQELNISEREFFGLRYQDNNRFRFWLDLTKPINRQLKGDFVFLSLRFRFYPLHPQLLKEDITRYQLFVQLRRDLLHGRIFCSQNDAIQLAGLILQAVLGDYDEEMHPKGYVSQYKLIIKQTERLEEKISEYHQQLQGMYTVDAEKEFLNRATSIETYGFDPYVVKDAKQSQDLVIGATCYGVLVFSKNQLLKNIPWKNLSKVDYTGKELKLYPSKDYYETENVASSSGNILNASSSPILSNGNISSKKSSSLKFICPNSVYAKHLWRHILSQQTFFTEDEARLVKPKFSKPRIPLFSRGSTFRCPTQKVLHEIEHNPLPARQDQPIEFQRYSIPKQISRADISAPSSCTGTLKSVRSTKDSPTTRGTLEVPESITPQRLLIHTESSDTLTATNLPPATSTPISSNYHDFAFTPPKETNSIFNTTLESQISTTSVQNTSDEDLINYQSQSIYPAISVMGDAEPAEKVLQDGNYDEEFPPLPPPPSSIIQPSNGTSTLNGHASNGSAVKERKTRAHKNATLKEDTVAKKVLRSILSILMFMLIFSTFAIIIFEANDGKGAKWTRDIHPISSFRQIIYDPSKDVVHQLLHRFYK